MAMEVEGPDGSVVEFPDGTPHEVIKGAMAKHFGPPTKTTAPTDNKQQTEDLPLATKALKALAFGAAQTRTSDANTLQKAGVNTDSINKNTEWLKQQAGLDTYDPASAHFADSSKPWTERIGYLPRSLLEGVPSMAQHIAASTVGGPLATLGSVGLTEGGKSVDTVRQADNTSPDVPLTPEQKARVAGNVGLQALLTEAGGRATLGATSPVKSVGMEGVKQAAGNVAKAAATDAVVGGLGAGGEKAILEKEMPTVADVALPGLAGAAVGTAFRAPGAAREATVATRFRALGDIDPQSRGQVADILGHYKGDFEATQKHLTDDLSQAKKGLDEVSRDQIGKAQIEFGAGQRIDPTKIEDVAKTSPEAARALQNLDTFGAMKSMDNGGVSNSFLGRVLNPFERTKGETSGDRFASALGRAAEYASIGHSMWSHSPETALAVFGTQLAGTGALHGIDRFTGAANPAKVITDKFSGTASPTDTIAQAKAAAKAKVFQQNDFRKVADLDAATRELEKAKLEEQKLKFRKIASKDAEIQQKRKEKETNANVSTYQKKAIGSLDLLDRLEASDRSKAAADEKAFWDKLRDQKDIMVRSQADEQSRVAQEAKAFSSLLKQQKEGLAIRERSEGASSTDAGMALRLSRLKERYRKKAEADAKKDELAVAKAIGRNNKKTESAMVRLNKSENVEALAKASKRVKEAEAKAREAKADADENMYVFEHRGQKTRVDKSSVDNPKAYGEKFAKLTDRRMNLLDEAKSLTTSKQAHKLLDQLATDWTDSRNDPVQARNHLERVLSKKSIPAEVRKHLISNWDRVEGTWATRKLESSENEGD